MPPAIDPATAVAMAEAATRAAISAVKVPLWYDVLKTFLPPLVGVLVGAYIANRAAVARDRVAETHAITHAQHTAECTVVSRIYRVWQGNGIFPDIIDIHRLDDLKSIIVFYRHLVPDALESALSTCYIAVTGQTLTTGTPAGDQQSLNLLKIPAFKKTWYGFGEQCRQLLTDYHSHGIIEL